MAIESGGKRPFPAVVIVFLLLLVCLYPGQWAVARLLPRFAGLATLTPGILILDIPVHISYTIDLVLVPCLFLLGYSVVILIVSVFRRVHVGRQLAHHLGAIFTGSFLLLVCLTAGALLSWGAQTYLPPRIQKGIECLGIKADLNTGFTPVHLHGNIIMVIALAIGIILFVARVKKAPRTKQSVQLTREQRMTPYQRMLAERRGQHGEEKPKPARPQPRTVDKEVPDRQHTRRPTNACSNLPLLSLQPEAVNYRPM